METRTAVSMTYSSDSERLPAWYHTLMRQTFRSQIDAITSQLPGELTIEGVGSSPEPRLVR